MPSLLKPELKPKRMRAGLTDVRVHDCRRSGATWAFMDGIPLDTVAAYLGDDPVMCRKHYAHLEKGYLDTVAHSLDRTMRSKEAA